MINKHRGALSLPSAVIIAGALIAVSIILINKPVKKDSKPSVVDVSPLVPAVTANDHVLGNPNAPIKLIEYSDLSCPFCKVYNSTLVSIMDTYGPEGKVAWVYRHFPLFRPINGSVPHPNSLMQAEALECAAGLGGNKAFFDFEKKWFSLFNENDATRPKEEDRKVLDGIAKDIGLDIVAFNECMSVGRYRDRIERAYDEALDLGINGTPLTIVVTPSNSQIALIGLQTFGTLKATIDTLLNVGTTTNSIKN